MVEYRGYGTSTGEPSEDGLKLDAQVSSLGATLLRFLLQFFLSFSAFQLLGVI